MKEKVLLIENDPDHAELIIDILKSKQMTDDFITNNLSFSESTVKDIISF